MHHPLTHSAAPPRRVQYETPLQAYRDIRPLLRSIGKQLGRGRKADVCVYDPYYCQGTVQRHLAALGFNDVINEKRDFYKDVAEGATPVHDVLVTNPPYSGDHKKRLLRFLFAQQQQQQQQQQQYQLAGSQDHQQQQQVGTAR